MSLSRSWRVFVSALKTSYDHIGKVMLFNVIWFAVGFSPFLVMTYLPIESNAVFLGSILLTILTLGGSTAAVHFIMNRVMVGEDTAVKDFFAGFKQFLGRGFILMVLALLGFLLFIFNLWFSQNYPSTVFLVLAGFWVWGIVFWYALLQFAFPFLTRQNVGVFLTIKRAALLTLDNPLASGLLVLFSLIVIVLSTILAAPLLIFTASFLALLQNYYFQELMLKYEVSEVADEPELEQGLVDGE